MTETCVKCGASLRRSKYDWIKDDYWFDEKGLAGCPKGNFHEVGEKLTHA